MTKKIFRSIVLVAVCALLASLLLIMGCLYDYFTGLQSQALRDELTFAASGVSQSGEGYLDTLSSSQYRLTWIAADGTVLYDTQADAASMENHASREEVQQALATGEGESSRYSQTLLEKTIYVAKRLPDGVDKVFLFGSYARGDATPASDVDLCVDAPKLRGLFALGGLYADLEDALKKSIDVVTTGSLKYNKDEAFLENLRKDRVLLYELS